MKQIREYLTTKVSKSTIKATDETIKQIVKEEMDKYGHNCDLNHIDVSKVTIMYSLFCCYKNDLGESYSDLNPDISEWDVSNVINMTDTFYRCENFNCDISNWDVSNVIHMDSMFCGCKKFNQYIGNWNVSNVRNIDYMFCGCTSFNQDLSKWNINHVISSYCIFAKCNIQEKYKPKFK